MRRLWPAAKARENPNRRQRFQVVLSVAILGILMLSSSAAGTVRRSVLAPPGWAPGGSPSSPVSQFAADARYAQAECGPNTLLVYRVRGSGESPGTDKLGAWTFALGSAAIAKGWLVRDLQADYSPPPVPLDAVKDLVLGPVLGAIKIWGAVAPYRDVATISWPAMRSALIAAYDRCPQRKIVIAGYSQGALVLRYLIPNLPAYLRARIVQVDLLGDPTADTKVDGPIKHPSQRGGRLTNGVDTWAGRLLHLGFFHQTAYPSDVASRTDQFCLAYDLFPAGAGRRAPSLPPAAKGLSLAAGVVLRNELGGITTFGHYLIRGCPEHNRFDLRQIMPWCDDEPRRVLADTLVFRERQRQEQVAGGVRALTHELEHVPIVPRRRRDLLDALVYRPKHRLVLSEALLPLIHRVP